MNLRNPYLFSYWVSGVVTAAGFYNVAEGDWLAWICFPLGVLNYLLGRYNHRRANASVWVLGRWIDLPGPNWELTAAFRTRDEATANAYGDEFVARLPVGERGPAAVTEFPDAEWISA